MSSEKEDVYGLSPEKSTNRIPAPVLNYLPAKPKHFFPKIALIGAGGISEMHLSNYKTQGFEVAAICNRNLGKAVEKRDKFYPKADVYSDYKKVMEREDIEVFDITPHPEDRIPIVEAALQNRKHVLSQKPFVLDLEDGQRLIDLAKNNGVKLAVNQNGRWAPHFSYISQVIRQGIIGEVASIDFFLQWDQTWVAGIEALESIKHMILFDFAVHWFDIANVFMSGREAKSVFASACGFEGQKFRPPSMASAILDYEGAQVRMGFNAHNCYGEEDVTVVVGTKGTIRSRGKGLNDQDSMTLFTQEGETEIELEGNWFTNGFQGTMGELLCAIEEGREPSNSAVNNLKSLELCFAALRSANTGKPVVPGVVSRME